MASVLVVDDEPEVLSLIERQLAGMGVEVVTASSGQQALERLREGGVDLLLTDLCMPRLGGLELAAAARAASGRPEVVVMTGQATVSDAVESLKLGAGDFLLKPFDCEALTSAVSRALARRARERERDPEREAEHLRSEFLALVGHELRTPLTVVMGYAALLLEGTFGETRQEQRHALTEIGDRARELHEAIEAILELAAPRGRAGPSPETFPVAALLEEVVAEHAAEAGSKGLRIWTESPDGLRLRAERETLKALLSRLVDNALKFTPSGGVLVTAALEEESGRVRLEVRDTGEGVRQEDEPRLGRRFTQLEPTLTRRHGGLGIGLALCARLARRLGAVLRVRGRAEGGCSASVSLPGWEQPRIPLKDGRRDVRSGAD